jgi:hypothetical protein
VIRQAEAIEIEQSGGRLAATLSLFTQAFSRLEEAGLIVRDFPKANDANIWIFGYLLDAVRDAPTVEKFERRHCDHTRMLTDMVSTLEWAGYARAAQIVRSRLVSASSETRNGQAYADMQRKAHMRRFSSFAWGVALEMHGKGIWPSHDDIEVYRQAYAAAVVPGDTPSFLLDVRDLVCDIALEVAIFDAAAAARIECFRGWKRPLI